MRRGEKARSLSNAARIRANYALRASARDELHATLAAFRSTNGFGRAIAAPQIGHNMRMIALNLGKEPFTMHNPVLFDLSEETFTLCAYAPSPSPIPHRSFLRQVGRLYELPQPPRAR